MGFVTNFALYAESSGARTLMGDSVVLSPDISLKAELPGAADEIRILQNGKIVAKGSGETIEFRPREAGSYRVEAYRKAHPWIFSNSLYIRSR